MSELSDISDRSDIENLVSSFYRKALEDTLLKPIFSVGISRGLENHLPTMYQFWENTLFYTGGYKGKLIEVHKNLNERIPFGETEFTQWLKLWNDTVDELFTGPKADEAKQKAKGIGQVMMLKINRQID